MCVLGVAICIYITCIICICFAICICYLSWQTIRNIPGNAISKKEVVIQCICFKAMPLCIQEGHGTILYVSITHTTIYVFHFTAVHCHTQTKSLSQSHRRLLVIFQYYCGKPFLMGKESKPFLFILFFLPQNYTASQS